MTRDEFKTLRDQIWALSERRRKAFEGVYAKAPQGCERGCVLDGLSDRLSTALGGLDDFLIWEEVGCPLEGDDFEAAFPTEVE